MEYKEITNYLKEKKEMVNMEKELDLLKKQILEFCKKYKISNFETVLIGGGRRVDGTIDLRDVIIKINY